MPFAENNLRDYLKNKKLSLNNKMIAKIKIAIDITNGIKYLHENDIIHGNLVSYI